MIQMINNIIYRKPQYTIMVSIACRRNLLVEKRTICTDHHRKLLEQLIRRCSEGGRGRNTTKISRAAVRLTVRKDVLCASCIIGRYAM